MKLIHSKAKNTKKIFRIFPLWGAVDPTPPMRLNAEQLGGHGTLVTFASEQPNITPNPKGCRSEFLGITFQPTRYLVNVNFSKCKVIQ